VSAHKPGLPSKRSMRHDRHFVDELAQRAGEGIGRMIPIGSIVSNPDQPRATLGDLKTLVQSIRTHGILEPLLVRRRPDHGYELISGERRFHAAMQVGLEEVPCIELDVPEAQALEIALVENLQRQDLSAFEEAEGFATLVEKYDYTHDQVALAVGRSRVTVTETLKLLVIPMKVRELCRHADITAKGLLLEIAKAGTAEAMTRLVEEIATLGLDRSTLRDRRRQLGSEEAERQGSTAAAANPRPFLVRFQDPGRSLSVSLSFRTESQPETADIIAALEDLIRQLRADGESERG